MQHYSLSVVGAGSVAGRPVDVDRRPASGCRPGRPRRRQVLAGPRAAVWCCAARCTTGRGRTTRASAFVEVTVGEATAHRQRGGHGRGPRPSTGLPSPGCGGTAGTARPPCPAPCTLVDARRGGEQGIVHLSYSDGIANVSVFEQRGRLDERPGWPVTSGRPPTATSVWVRGEVPRRVVWSSGGTVYTVVADAPERTVDAVVAALPHRAAGDASRSDGSVGGWTGWPPGSTRSPEGIRPRQDQHDAAPAEPGSRSTGSDDRSPCTRTSQATGRPGRSARRPGRQPLVGRPRSRRVGRRPARARTCPRRGPGRWRTTQRGTTPWRHPRRHGRGSRRRCPRTRLDRPDRGQLGPGPDREDTVVQPPGHAYDVWSRTDSLGREPRPSVTARTGVLVALGAAIALLAGVVGGGLGYLLADRESGSVTVDGASLGAAPRADVERPDGSIAGVAAKVLPSVVQIKVEHLARARPPGPASSSTTTGLVVTNNHVVADAAGRGRGVVQRRHDDRRRRSSAGRASYDLAVLRSTPRTCRPCRSATPTASSSATRSSRSARRSACPAR